MRVSIRLYGASFPAGSREHYLELPEPATAKQALEALAETLEGHELEDLMKYMVHVNGVRAERNHMLSDGDNIRLLRTLEGG